MLRTILFDLGNVIVHFSHARMCEQIGAVLEWTGPETREFLIDSGLMWNFERGLVTEGDLLAAVEKQRERKIELVSLSTACSDIFQLNEPLVPVIESLKRRGLRLVVLSNTSHWHVDWIRRHWNVLDLFDELVLSYEVGAIKPEPAIYEAAMKAIRCRPEECFYTDDIPAYVAAGREFGLQAEVFTDVAALIPQLAARGITI
ncbi:Alpha-D-glucose-1-phosphate phosphatase YihX [Caulifigura coniformis]|uniref:Alpha-D-glucose-1-phosphate phosphatase YihX n=1 Tax=Caulifigura coniformis TaxID=2527983 RepID=A0A517SMR0_9PLAN|nr:HAD family phosphatase [Caulifigura coniformis]QDT57396.1 Alpha-D-glucose-1-phosphate phosphatase YihX [Caulifigura coniformis]